MPATKKQRKPRVHKQQSVDISDMDRMIKRLEIVRKALLVKRKAILAGEIVPTRDYDAIVQEVRQRRAGVFKD